MRLSLNLSDQRLKFVSDFWLDFSSLLCQINLFCCFRNIEQISFNTVPSASVQPRENIRKMPYGRITLMNGSRKFRCVCKHQLAHILAGHARDLCCVGQSDKVRRSLDQASRRNGLLHIL